MTSDPGQLRRELLALADVEAARDERVPVARVARPRRRQPALDLADREEAARGEGQRARPVLRDELAAFAMGCCIQTPSRYRMIDAGVDLFLTRRYDLDQIVRDVWPYAAAVLDPVDWLDNLWAVAVYDRLVRRRVADQERLRDFEAHGHRPLGTDAGGAAT